MQEPASQESEVNATRDSSNESLRLLASVESSWLENFAVGMTEGEWSMWMNGWYIQQDAQ